jgi:hypothetical protein
MPVWVLGILIALLIPTLLMVPVGAWTWGARKRYCRAVAAWASARGWIYREGSAERTWETPLPRVGNKGVRLQVDGTHTGRTFTLAYADSLRWRTRYPYGLRRQWLWYTFGRPIRRPRSHRGRGSVARPQAASGIRSLTRSSGSVPTHRAGLPLWFLLCWPRHMLRETFRYGPSVIVN